MKSLKQRVYKRQKNTEEHILPLINVVFLLLIFFMIAGRLTTSDPFRIAPSKSVSNTEINQETAIIHIDENGELAFQNVKITQKELNKKIVSFLQKNPNAIPRLKVNGDYSAGKILSFMTDLRKLGIEKISLITQLETAQ